MKKKELCLGGGDLSKLIQHLSAMRNELIRYHGGGGIVNPISEISDWRLTTSQIPIIVGQVRFHPRLTDGVDIATSPLVYIDYEGKKARTFNTWYHLEGDSLQKPLAW